MYFGVLTSKLFLMIGLYQKNPDANASGFFISSFRANELLYVLVLGNGLSLLLIF